jgi:hypothetical protein
MPTCRTWRLRDEPQQIRWVLQLLETLGDRSTQPTKNGQGIEQSGNS